MSDQTSRAAQAAQWALARVKPDYFGWPPEAQERFRCRMSEEDRLLADRELLEALFEIRTRTRAEFGAALGALDPAARLLFNDAALLTTGIGDDYFASLDVQNYTGQNVLAFETLYDFDVAQFREQEVRGNAASPAGYQGRIGNDWARLRIDGEFSYASLSMAASYLSGLLEQCGADWIGKLEASAGWPTGTGKTISQRQRRRNLSEIRSRVCRYSDERYGALLAEFDRNPRRAVYMIDTSVEHQPDVHFIFSDRTALREIRFRHFVRDCRALLRPVSDLAETIEREMRGAVEFVELSHQDVLRNPPVKR